MMFARIEEEQKVSGEKTAEGRWRKKPRSPGLKRQRSDTSMEWVTVNREMGRKSRGHGWRGCLEGGFYMLQPPVLIQPLNEDVARVLVA